MTAPRGPVPKRSTQRRRANKPEIPVETAPSGRQDGGTRRWPSAKREWHSLAADLWRALGESGQAQFYEPSDVAYARVWTDVLSQQLKSGKPSAMMMAAWDSACARLLVTEGDRRRVRIELERGEHKDPDKEAGVASMQAWRTKLAGGGS